MGSNSAGPLLVWTTGQSVLWDCDAMRPIDAQGPRIGSDANYKSNVRVSADGRAFISGTDRISGQSFHVMTVDGNRTSITDSPDIYSSAGWFAQPSRRCQSHLSRRWIHSERRFETGASRRSQGRALVASPDPRFFFAVNNVMYGKTSELRICTAADCRPIYTFPSVEKMMPDLNIASWGQCGGEPCIYYLPQNNILATLPDSNDKVVIRHFDLRKAIEEQGTDYLLVVSKPPTRVDVGSTYAYSLETWSKRGGVKYRLDDGPKGMTVSPAGEVRWQATQRPIGGVARRGVFWYPTPAGPEIFTILRSWSAAMTPCRRQSTP